MYSTIFIQLLYIKLGREKQRIGEIVTNENIRRMEMLAKTLLEASEDCNLATIKFHTLDRTQGDISLFGALNFLYTSSFKHFNYVLKKFIKLTSMRRGRTLEETFKAMNASLEIEE